MVHIQKIAVLLVVVSLHACIAQQVYKPEDLGKLKPLHSLYELNGTYENHATGATIHNRRAAISRYVWKNLSNNEHNKIQKVSIQVVGNTSARISTVGYGKNLSSLVNLRKSQTIKNGKLSLSDSSHLDEAFIPLLTFSKYNKDKQVLLDEGRNIIFITNKSKSGMFIGVPYKNANTRYFRFRRIR
jgi:hypothetical protein